jgi:hypothetical protein
MTETAKKPRTPWGDGRVAFRAHSSEIRAKINLGWPRSRVWREFKDRLGGLSISQFNRHVQALLASPEGVRELGAPPPPPPPSQTATEKYWAKRKAETGKSSLEAKSELGDFHFDPMDAYRKKFD